MENVKIREFLDSFPGFGYGDGSGYGFGSGYGDGNGSGFGYGFGSGFGDGNGSGFGDGFGSGDGDGSGRGIKSVNGIEICNIDGVQTAIFQIHGNIAKGAILQSDLTFTPCYIAKQDGLFAHGETIREANSRAARKAVWRICRKKTGSGRSCQSIRIRRWHIQTKTCSRGITT